MNRTIIAAMALGLGLSFVPVAAEAASYASLKRKGYKTGPFTRSPAGTRGWYLTGGGKRYFCRLGVSAVRSGNGLAFFTTGGRMIRAGKAGRRAAGAPKLSDLRAGRLRARDVGSCRVSR